MRDVSRIWEAWQGSGDGAGNFIGDLKPSTRVTVEKAYWLNTDLVTSIGQWKRGPARWWQRAETGFSTPTEYVLPRQPLQDMARREVSSSQVETELPNVLMVSKNKSLDSDAGTCDIVIANVLPPEYGKPEGADGELGQMGYFTPTRGDSQEARARWGHTPNEWKGILGENALLRVYEGFGGEDLSIIDAVVDGYLVQKGAFLVDNVTTSTDGTLHLKCRDMGKLLTDQQLFPPLVPRSLYPLKYCRYKYDEFEIPPNPAPPPLGAALLTQYTAYLDSSNEDYYGGELGPHPGTDAFDWSFNDPPGPPGTIKHQRTYWLSEPHSSAIPDFPPWIEFSCDNNPVNCFYFHAWAGNQTMYVSVFENGSWVTPEAPRQGGFIAGIPYVTRANSAWEGGPPGPLVYLPRVYRAEKIRITFTRLAVANEFDGAYHAGARKIVAHLDMGAVHSMSLVFAGAPIPYNTDQRAGYWQVRSTGSVYAFGDARTYQSHEPMVHIWPIIGFEAHPDGLGYWTIDYAGMVRSYGSATHHGDDHILGRFDVVDMACTPTGDGYWILHKDGTVSNHGDADEHGDGSYSGTMANGGDAFARSLESHPVDFGYWILYTNGEVEAHDLTDYGSASEAGFLTNEYMASIRRTTDGAGYWVTSGAGRVQNFGNAQDLGDPPIYPEEKWALGLCWDMIPYSLGNNGYAIQHADGNLDFFGAFEQFGSIGQGGGQLRSDGDYKDYCLDEETEVLTKRGWLRHDEVEVGDEVLSMSPLNGRSSWSAISSIYRSHRRRDMVLMEGTVHSSLTTPDHRWLVQKGSELTWSTTESLGWDERIPVAADPGERPDAKYEDAFVELVAWFYTEGWWNGDRLWSGAIAQSAKNGVYVDRIRSVLTQLYGDPGTLPRGFNRVGPMWSERVLDRPEGPLHEFRLRKPVLEEIAEVAPDKVPSAEFISNLSLSQLELFVETSIDADGWRTTTNRVGFRQKDQRRTDAFVMACALLGRGTSTHGETTTVLKHRFISPVRAAAQSASFRREVVDYDGVVWCPTVPMGHNYLARRRGSVYFTGNSDIIRDLALWAGFLLKQFGGQTRPDVFGNIESTGAFAKECLPEDIFDKHPVIDAMRQIKEIVGYIIWIDDDGGFRFESPNWWSMGNYLIDGTPFDFMPEIDEKVNCTDYQVTSSDTNDRSEIIIGSADPTKNYKDTVVTRLVPPGADKLKGLCKPAMWTNGVFTDQKEQKVMADLIAMHIWFASRQGEVTCIGNPLIDVNDQVRIYERQTGETHIHYVRGVSTTHDLVSGEYTMTLTTHWLGGSPYGQTPLFYACAPRPQGDGYWQVNFNGSVYSFGAAQLYSKNEPDSHTEWVVGMRSTSSGDGYWTVDKGGKVLSYGDAEHYGQLRRLANDIIDMAVTPSGEGYWLLATDGTVFPFGDALALGDAVVDGEIPGSGRAVQAHSIEAHPVDDGYWVLLTDGDVQPFGVDDYGNAGTTGYAVNEYNVRVRATPAGDGLWVTSNLGTITELGAAVNYGNGTSQGEETFERHEVWDLMPNLSPGHTGYALQHANGLIDTTGDFAFFGAVGGEGEPTPNNTGWAIVSSDAYVRTQNPGNVVAVNEYVRKFLERTGSKSAANAVLSNFNTKVPVTSKVSP